MISIIAIGKKHEAWVQSGVERYSRRLRAPWDVKWVLLPHSSREGLAARQDESERILSRLQPSDTVVLLDERGAMLDSPTLAKKLHQYIESPCPLIIVIGGAYGVTDELQQRADLVWSLSPAVYPHQLVRLMLVEQLYRSQEIVGNRPYHHE